MGDRAKPALYTIPAHRAFADALVAGILAQQGNDPVRLAQGMILLPTNRGVRAVTDAFVRASGGGLILPRMVALGDPELGEAAGSALDPADAEAPPPPAVAPSARRMILARLVEQERQRAGQPVTAAEAVRLAGVNPRPYKIAVFALMGLLSGLAALFQVSRLEAADPNAGVGMELQVIAAVVIGLPVADEPQ